MSSRPKVIRDLTLREFITDLGKAVRVNESAFTEKYPRLACSNAERFITLGEVVISPHVASLIVVFPITFFTGFWLNRNVAFRATEVGQGLQIFKYALSVVGSLLLNYICIKFFVEVLNIWPTPSKALTTVVCVVYSYLAGRYFTFKKAA